MLLLCSNRLVYITVSQDPQCVKLRHFYLFTYWLNTYHTMHHTQFRHLSLNAALQQWRNGKMHCDKYIKTGEQVKMRWSLGHWGFWDTMYIGFISQSRYKFKLVYGEWEGGPCQTGKPHQLGGRSYSNSPSYVCPQPLCNRTFLWRCLCCHFVLLTFLLLKGLMS